MKAEYERQGHSCTILDTFQYISPALADFLSEGYLLVTEKAKTAYKVGYRLAEKRKWRILLCVLGLLGFAALLTFLLRLYDVFG